VGVEVKVTFCAYDRLGYVGGPNAGLIRLLPALKARGIDVRCLFLTFAPHGQCPTIRALEAEGIPCRSTRYHPTTELRVRWLLRQLKESPPDIFVPNLMPAAYFAGKWCRDAGIPTIGVLRSVDAFHEGFLEEFASGYPEFRQTAFVGVSQHAVHMIREAGMADTRAVQIPSPVSIPKVPVAHSTPFRVAYSGRIIKRNKRADLVVDMFCGAAEAVSDTEYTLLGHGPDWDEVSAHLDECGRNLPVTMAGRIDSRMMDGELSRHHCLLLASEYEGLPLALMEGMAAGLVPMGMRGCTGVEELIEDGETGFLLDDPILDFPKVVSRLKEDPDLFARVSGKARERIMNLSALDVVAEKWIALFNEIKNDEGPRRALSIPVRLNLPPCNPKVACEDDRADAFGCVCALATSLSPFFAHGDRTQFLSPRCLPSTIDNYTIRKGIIRALKTALPKFSGIVADVGAGVAPYKQLVLESSGVDSYVALDLAESSYAPPDVLWDGERLPLADESVETVMATEVLEHCSTPDLLVGEACRALKQDGVFFGTVPFLWPIHDVPHDHWRFTPWSLKMLLERNGFSDVQVTGLGGYESAMAQMIGLWVRRRSRDKGYRRFVMPVLSLLAAPVVWGLTRLDKEVDDFREGQMITGFSFTARKGDGV